jgi:hypothetical protein
MYLLANNQMNNKIIKSKVQYQHKYQSLNREIITENIFVALKIFVQKIYDCIYVFNQQ